LTLPQLQRELDGVKDLLLAGVSVGAVVSGTEHVAA